MTDEELLQLVRDFTEENGREPMQADVLYDRELKQRFGPWNRMLEQAQDLWRSPTLTNNKGEEKNAGGIRNTEGKSASKQRQKQSRGHRLQQKRPYTNKFVHYTQNIVFT